MSDEYGHTRQGNNNAWSSDDEINWFRWDELERPENQQLMNYLSSLISLRKAHPFITTGRFLTDRDILWHGLEPLKPNWGPDNRFVAFTLRGAQIYTSPLTPRKMM